MLEVVRLSFRAAIFLITIVGNREANGLLKRELKANQYNLLLCHIHVAFILWSARIYNRHIIFMGNTHVFPKNIFDSPNPFN